VIVASAALHGASGPLFKPDKTELISKWNLLTVKRDSASTVRNLILEVCTEIVSFQLNTEVTARLSATIQAKRSRATDEIATGAGINAS
jgi:hypothetical protein